MNYIESFEKFSPKFLNFALVVMNYIESFEKFSPKFLNFAK